jgi:hypothetical protein
VPCRSRRLAAADAEPTLDGPRRTDAGGAAAAVAQRQRARRPERTRRQSKAESRRGRVRIDLLIEIDELDRHVAVLRRRDRVVAVEGSSAAVQMEPRDRFTGSLSCKNGRRPACQVKGLYCEIPWPKNSPVRSVPLNRSFIQTFQRTTNTSHAAHAAQFLRPSRSSDSSLNVTSCLRGRPLAAADVQVLRLPADDRFERASAALEASAQARPNCLRNSPLARVNKRRRVGERLAPARLM